MIDSTTDATGAKYPGARAYSMSELVSTRTLVIFFWTDFNPPAINVLVHLNPTPFNEKSGDAWRGTAYFKSGTHFDRVGLDECQRR